jgi:hypothetical protein
MSEEYKEFEKYGFQPANEDCIKECEKNPLLKPILYRYIGMGHYEILAVVPKYFLITVGGANGYDVMYNHNELNKITMNDAMTKQELLTKLEGKSWVEVVNVSNFDNCDIQQCIEHRGC